MARLDPKPVAGELYLAHVAGRGWTFLTHDPVERWWYAGSEVVFPDRWFSASKNSPCAMVTGPFVSRVESALEEVEFDWRLSCDGHGVDIRLESSSGDTKKGLHHEIPWSSLDERGDLVRHEVACVVEKFRRGV